MLFDTYELANGFLFIGDPHLTSKKPNRRLEEDHEIIKVTTDKLEQAILIANNLNAVPVITGDLFTYAKDSRALLITLTLRALNKAIHPVLCLPGNHDLLASEVTDDTALAIIAESGKLILFPTLSGPVATFKFKNKIIGLCGVAHDYVIPDSVTKWFDKVDDIILVTHHDIAFDGAYPGSLDVYPIEGCAMVVNGHMHRTKPALVAGNTTWVNIGNIFRQTIADSKHVPSVWYWEPGMPIPSQHALRYVVEVFDWTGKFIKSSVGSLIPDLLNDDEDDVGSVFVSELSAMIGSEMPKSHDAGIILDDINAVKEDNKPKNDVIKIIDALHKAVSKEALENNT